MFTECEKMKKTWAIILTGILAISALSLVASVSARPFMNWNFNRMPGPMNRQMNGPSGAPIQQSFTSVEGVANQWGTTNVTGSVEAQARTIILNSTTTREGASVTALWTTNTTRPISGFRDKENFTYTYYTANLVNASLSSLNVTGYSLFMNGTWNVFKDTETFTINTDSSGNVINFNHNTNGVALATQAYGTLTVPTGSNNFTIAITGVNNLTGTVHFQRISSRTFNPFIVNNTSTSTAVTTSDVSAVMSAFGSSPGWGNYNQRLDYNFNGQIDIADLATAAANLNIQ